MAETDLNPKQQNLNPQTTPNPTKFYTNFMYKAIIVSIFLVVVPLFPSQAPDFINQTLHTGSWELLQLLFVGIAVSYGLFSTRSEEGGEKEPHASKFDNAQLYVSRLLQVSSVFDDETENPPELDESKVQTWNSQYFRGEPMVVVAQENSVLDQEQSGNNPQIVEKPLLLPVRSLKGRVLDSSMNDPINESSVKANSVSRSGSRRFSSNSNKPRNGVSPEDLVEKTTEENVVLRSPIPWRSRSGRMEVKKEDLDGPSMFSLPPSMEDSEFDQLESPFRSRSFSSSRSNSTSLSPSLLSSQSFNSSRTNSTSPSPSLSSDMPTKNVEDFIRKKGSFKSSIPPPPPPPPPFFHKYSRMKPNYVEEENDHGLSEKEMRRIVRNAANGLTGNAGEDFSSIGKSVRTTKGREFNKEFIEKTFNEPFLGKNGQADKSISSVMSKQNFYKYPKEEEYVEEVVMETEDESESEYEEDDEFEELPNKEEMAMKNASDVGPDVDKKADEFIAKFREQIRQQRMASIRRSAGQIPKTSDRNLSVNGSCAMILYSLCSWLAFVCVLIERIR